MNPLESLAHRIEGARSLDGVAAQARAQAHEHLVDNDRLDSLLGGDWLGHRLHPVLVQIPMGAWLMATLLSVKDADKHADAVQALLATGVLSAVPAALTGVHDLATTSGSATRVGLVHAGVNDVALVLFLTAWRRQRKGDRRGARRLMLAGAGVAGGGAYLGGHLVYRLGVGIDE